MLSLKTGLDIKFCTMFSNLSLDQNIDFLLKCSNGTTIGTLYPAIARYKQQKIYCSNKNNHIPTSLINVNTLNPNLASSFYNKIGN